MNLLKFLTANFLFCIFPKKERVHEIKNFPIGLELSDGDRAALYGWPEIELDVNEE